jgi:hypothetical protein
MAHFLELGWWAPGSWLPEGWIYKDSINHPAVWLLSFFLFWATVFIISFADEEAKMPPSPLIETV